MGKTTTYRYDARISARNAYYKDKKNITGKQIIQEAIRIMSEFEDGEGASLNTIGYRITTTDGKIAKEFEKECRRTGYKISAILRTALESLLEEYGVL